MRYTLRLLTLQQFQRAAALICACEVIRCEDVDRWGSEPFRIGLWVGQRSTPNWVADADEAIKQLKKGGNAKHRWSSWCGQGHSSAARRCAARIRRCSKSSPARSNRS
jgi:hypothetical protein